MELYNTKVQLSYEICQTFWMIVETIDCEKKTSYELKNKKKIYSTVQNFRHPMF